VNYFELTSCKKGKEILHLYLKEINSIPKEYRQNKLSSKGFFEQIPFRIFPFENTKYISISPEEEGLTKILAK
jgi:hypothetical protein